MTMACSHPVEERRVRQRVGEYERVVCGSCATERWETTRAEVPTPIHFKLIQRDLTAPCTGCD